MTTFEDGVEFSGGAHSDDFTGNFHGPATKLPGCFPSSSTAEGEVNDWGHDGTYLYICVAANTWKRILMSSF